MPISRQARMILTAISPRLAIRILENMLGVLPQERPRTGAGNPS